MRGKFINFLAVLSFLVALVVIGCAEHPAIQHARLTYPECDVSILEERAFDIIVEVRCPHQEPFKKRYTRRD